MNMKKFPIYALAAMALLSLAGCKDDYEEYDNSYLLDYDQTMTLSASSDYVELDAEALDEDVLTKSISLTTTSRRPNANMRIPMYSAVPTLPRNCRN